jgi:hypothetical protein
MDSKYPLKSAVSEAMQGKGQLHKLLVNPSLSGTARGKTYQVVNFNCGGTSLGVIVKNQESIISVYDNSNANLGLLLMMAEIIPDRKGGVRVDHYLAIDIGFLHLGFSTSNKLSLGAVFLLAEGVAVDKLMEPHHEKHAFINISGTVSNLSRAEHARESAEFKTMAQVRTYLAKDILHTDDKGLERFERNVSMLTKAFIKHRGICTGDLDLVGDDMGNHLANRDAFKLSVL